MPICADLIINCSFGAIPKSDELNTLDHPHHHSQGSMSVLMSVVPILSALFGHLHIEKTEQVKLPFFKCIFLS
jgi:hypothetical protein